MYNGFGDDGQSFGLDNNEPMDINPFVLDENMNDVMDGGFEPIQSPVVDTTQLSSNHGNIENGNKNAKTLLTDWSIPSTTIVRKKKRTTKMRQTLMVDQETEISNEFMRKRLTE